MRSFSFFAVPDPVLRRISSGQRYPMRLVGDLRQAFRSYWRALRRGRYPGRSSEHGDEVVLNGRQLYAFLSHVNEQNHYDWADDETAEVLTDLYAGILETLDVEVV